MRVASRDVGLEGNAENVQHMFHFSRAEYRTKSHRKDRQTSENMANSGIWEWYSQIIAFTKKSRAMNH
jgi:hypothetical protein